MISKKMVLLVFGIFIIIMIALTGAFSEIIRGFGLAMGFYGVIIGILIVLAIIIELLGVGGRRR